MIAVKSAVSYPSKLTSPFGCGVSTGCVKMMRLVPERRGRSRGSEKKEGRQ